MVEPAIIIVRLMQYTGAAVLCGLPLFCCYAAPALWPRRLLATSAALLAGAALASLRLYAASLEGSAADVVAYLPLGKAAVIRAVLALITLVIVITSAGLAARRQVAFLGVGIAASLAWLGHAGSGENDFQLAADVVHAVAASLWIGALYGLVLLAWASRDDESAARLRAALIRFSAVGIPLVAVLALSGLANGYYTVGPEQVLDLTDNPYGRLLALKLILFAAMLVLAALHRRRLPERLAGRALARLRLTLAGEAGLGLAVLALVAWLGTLEPPVAA